MLRSKGRPALLNHRAEAWVAFRVFFYGYTGLLRGFPPLMENQVEKRMENEMETRGIQGFKVPKLIKLPYWVHIVMNMVSPI